MEEKSNDFAEIGLVYKIDDDDGLWFEDLITPSGHSVVHIVLFKPDAFSNLNSKLVATGVKIEFVHKNIYLAVDVPPNILYTDLKRVLDEEFHLGNIDFSEACLSERHR